MVRAKATSTCSRRSPRRMPPSMESPTVDRIYGPIRDASNDGYYIAVRVPPPRSKVSRLTGYHPKGLRAGLGSAASPTVSASMEVYAAEDDGSHLAMLPASGSERLHSLRWRTCAWPLPVTRTAFTWPHTTGLRPSTTRLFRSPLKLATSEGYDRGNQAAPTAPFEPT